VEGNRDIFSYIQIFNYRTQIYWLRWLLWPQQIADVKKDRKFQRQIRN